MQSRHMYYRHPCWLGFESAESTDERHAVYLPPCTTLEERRQAYEEATSKYGEPLPWGRGPLITTEETQTQAESESAGTETTQMQTRLNQESFICLINTRLRPAAYIDFFGPGCLIRCMIDTLNCLGLDRFETQFSLLLMGFQDHWTAKGQRDMNVQSGTFDLANDSNWKIFCEYLKQKQKCDPLLLETRDPLFFDRPCWYLFASRKYDKERHAVCLTATSSETQRRKDLGDAIEQHGALLPWGPGSPITTESSNEENEERCATHRPDACTSAAATRPGMPPDTRYKRRSSLG